MVMADTDHIKTNVQPGVEALCSAGGKFLTFRLDAEEYGIEIFKVREIIGLVSITSIPKIPYFFRGIFRLRGQVIPVVDLRLKFEMESAEDTDETCIIVVEISSKSGIVLVGILVDAVSEVLDIGGSSIEPVPIINGGFDSRFILGIGKVNNTVKILLNIDQVLADIDASMISGLEMEEALTEDEENNQLFADMADSDNLKEVGNIESKPDKNGR